MARIIEEQLRQKINNGVTVRQLRQTLAYEMNNLVVVTMPTLGAFSRKLSERETAARQKLDRLAEDAAHNVPIIQKLLAEMGESEDIKTCKTCQQKFVGAGNVCSTCYEPSEY